MFELRDIYRGYDRRMLARVGAYAVELQDVFDRMLTLSTGAIAIVATFAEKFSGGSVWLAVTALVLFALTIVFCLSVRASVATWKLAFVAEPDLPVGPPPPPADDKKEGLPKGMEAWLAQQKADPQVKELVAKEMEASLARLEARLKEGEGWPKVLEPRLAEPELDPQLEEVRHFMRALGSRLTYWLMCSIALAGTCFVLALGFLTAFAISALT